MGVRHERTLRTDRDDGLLAGQCRNGVRARDRDLDLIEPVGTCLRQGLFGRSETIVIRVGRKFEDRDALRHRPSRLAVLGT